MACLAGIYDRWFQLFDFVYGHEFDLPVCPGQVS